MPHRVWQVTAGYTRVQFRHRRYCGWTTGRWAGRIRICWRSGFGNVVDGIAWGDGTGCEPALVHFEGKADWLG